MENVAEAAQEALYEQIYILRKKGWNTDVWETHLRNLALDQAKIIQYEARLDATRNAVYLANEEILDAAVNAIADAIKRAMP
jgi:hypothetical protein